MKFMDEKIFFIINILQKMDEFQNAFSIIGGMCAEYTRNSLLTVKGNPYKLIIMMKARSLTNALVRSHIRKCGFMIMVLDREIIHIRTRVYKWRMDQGYGYIMGERIF